LHFGFYSCHDDEMIKVSSSLDKQLASTPTIISSPEKRSEMKKEKTYSLTIVGDVGDYSVQHHVDEVARRTACAWLAWTFFRVAQPGLVTTQCL
jgi:hypothetical protein